MGKIFVICSLFIFFSSCATKKDKDFDKVRPDLMDVFQLEGDNFKKFRPAPVYEKKTEEVVEKKDTSAKISKNKISPLIKIISEYPKGYPNNYKIIDKKSELIWKKFKPNYYVGEQLVMAVKYLGISTGQLKILTESHVYFGDKKTIHFKAAMKSSSFYKMFYQIDDFLDIFVEEQAFLPVKYSFIQNETNQTVNDLQLFDYENKKTYFVYRRLKNGMVKNINKDVFIPKYFQSYLSVFFFFRGLPLSVGSSYEFPIVSKAKVGILQAKVEKIEKIDTKLGEYEAVKLDATVSFPESKKKDHISIWFSNDDEKYLLKFQAAVKIGDIVGAIEELRPGERL